MTTPPIPQPEAPAISPVPQHGIVLIFDPTGEARLKALDAALLKTGIKTFPGIYPEFRPHITLAAFHDPFPAAFSAALQSFAAAATSQVVTISSLALFPTAERVAFLAPAPTLALLKLQANLLALLNSFNLHPILYYLPGMWVPHCTVAVDVQSDQLGLLETVCLQANIFGRYTLTGLGLVSFPPPELLAEYPLAIPPMH